MMRWSELERQQPWFAALGRERLEGEFWLSMLHGSFKAVDLIRDSRVLVHGIVTSRDGGAGEYKVRGLAIMEDSLDRQRGYADEVRARIGWTPEAARFHLFQVDIADVTFIRYDEETGDQSSRVGRMRSNLSAVEPRRPLSGRANLTTSSSIPSR